MNTCCLVNHRFISECCIVEVRSTLEKKEEIEFYEKIKKRFTVYYHYSSSFRCFDVYRNLQLSLYTPPLSIAITAFRYMYQLQ